MDNIMNINKLLKKPLLDCISLNKIHENLTNDESYTLIDWSSRHWDALSCITLGDIFELVIKYEEPLYSDNPYQE